ncbi:MAG: hypothetical protein JSW64_10170 [Candidatus Zixiibacteriota bacterium]|nr:MAG: hypothetical protein JSW64_10170 [candidate division Zixibacteria bacterium]
MIIIAQQIARGQELKGQVAPEYPQKKWQLKFSVGANFIPHPFDGTKIYIQRMISDGKAVRFGIGFIDYQYDRDYRYADIYPPEDNYNNIDLNTAQLISSAALDYIAYLKSRKKIKPFLGIGPFFEYIKTDVDQTYRPSGTASNPQTYVTDREDLGAGFNALFGVEYRFWRRLSFQVEYSLRFLVERSSGDIVSNNPNVSPQITRERTTVFVSYRIEASNIITGLSIAF